MWNTVMFHDKDRFRIQLIMVLNG